MGLINIELNNLFQLQFYFLIVEYMQGSVKCLQVQKFTLSFFQIKQKRF